MRIGITTPSKSKYRASGPRGYPTQGPVNIILVPGSVNQTAKNAGKFPLQVLGQAVKGVPTFRTQTVFPLADRPDPTVPDPRQDFQVVNFVNPNNSSDYLKAIQRNWFINEETNTLPCFQIGIGFGNNRVIPAGSSISATLTAYDFDATDLNDTSTWLLGSPLDLFNGSPKPPKVPGESNQVTGTITLAQAQAGIPGFPKMVNYDNINLNIPAAGAGEVVGVFNKYLFNLPENMFENIQERKNVGLAIEYNITLQFAGEGPLNYTGFLKLAFRGEPIK